MAILALGSIGNSQLLPTGKVIIDQAPPRKVVRQVSPGATRLCDIHDRVENLPSLKTWLPTQPAPLWQILPDNCPFPVAHIAVVLLSGAASQALQQSICFSTSLFTHFFTGFERSRGQSFHNCAARVTSPENCDRLANFAPVFLTG